MYYILVNNKAIPTDDVKIWATGLNNNSIKQDCINDITISTVFLGLDHSFGADEPLLFETMVFGGVHDGFQERYHTYDEAIEGHRVVCSMVDRKRIERNEKLNIIIKNKK